MVKNSLQIDRYSYLKNALYDLHKGEHRHVSYYLVLQADVVVVELALLVHSFNLLWIVELPNEHERLSDIFVGRATVLVDH